MEEYVELLGPAVSAFGFAFLDNGTIQFRIPAAALRAGDWTQVTIEPDSG